MRRCTTHTCISITLARLASIPLRTTHRCLNPHRPPGLSLTSYLADKKDTFHVVVSSAQGSGYHSIARVLVAEFIPHAHDRLGLQTVRDVTRPSESGLVLLRKTKKRIPGVLNTLYIDYIYIRPFYYCLRIFPSSPFSLLRRKLHIRGQHADASPPFPLRYDVYVCLHLYCKRHPMHLPSSTRIEILAVLLIFSYSNNER